jgi:hypothetical protein
MIWKVKSMNKDLKTNILIIDGQGGKLGRQLIDSILSAFSNVNIIAVGTNSIATAFMVKSGVEGATGENAVIVNSHYVDIIVGPIGIVIADSLLGEITPAMATAVGQSRAHRILLPMNKCGNTIAGFTTVNITKQIESTIETIRGLISK